MKSWRDSFHIWSSNKSPVPALGPLPKSAVGLVPHKEEQQVTKLWSDMLKSEQGCRKAMLAVRQYNQKALAVQHEEEKLLAKMKEISAGLFTLDFQGGMDALDELLPQIRGTVPEATERLESEVSFPVREYHALYVNIDNLRAKRDLLVADLNRMQDKIEKLRLKGRRSTDVLVEKEKTMKQVHELQVQLLKEVVAFHKLRTEFMMHPLHCYTDTQFLQYGSQAQQYKTHVVGGPAHQSNLSSINQSTAKHLEKLKGLNITDS